MLRISVLPYQRSGLLAKPGWAGKTCLVITVIIRDLWCEGFTLLPCPSVAGCDTNIEADGSSTSALCRGTRSERLQAAFREEESPAALPFAHSQGESSLAPAVFPPRLSHQMLAISGTVTNRGWPLGAASVGRGGERGCVCASRHACRQVCPRGPP